jgi:hypothetical protein
MSLKPACRLVLCTEFFLTLLTVSRRYLMKVKHALRKWQLVPVLMVALAAGFAGTAFAGTAAPAQAVVNAPSQSPDTPPDCRNYPDDPRCRDRR